MEEDFFFLVFEDWDTDGDSCISEAEMDCPCSADNAQHSQDDCDQCRSYYSTIAGDGDCISPEDWDMARTGTHRPNSAGFATSGAFHFLHYSAPDKINILGGTRMPHLLEGFSDPDSIDLADFRNVSSVSGSDLKASVQDVGSTTIGGLEYGISVRKHSTEREIIVYRPSQMVGGQAIAFGWKSFAAITSAAGSSVDFKGGWGSIWVYQGTVYVSNNNGG